MHCSLKKKGQNGVVLNNIVGLLLPLDAHEQGKKMIFSLLPPAFPHLSLSPSHLPKDPHTTHTLLWPTTMMKK
jgi:hypothetical protein